MQLKILKNDAQNSLQQLSKFQVDISVQLQQDEEWESGWNLLLSLCVKQFIF